ncbi:class I adenylate-forming enzyme family protein [Pseudofrankia asymbiotica]|uniref:AMP-dependent synthetase n=1 Tax=Pseudofrankia asymbiotica TaxID=1834516 RepID=A0A1V2I5R8_9ACTN|nr:fatty acid--CoA ligase family protein [Pseudofrankia asymbiotica]ONH26406.1 hypothetical protein BL253_24800 [Pseudofrankia asymbiotica]
MNVAEHLRWIFRHGDSTPAVRYDGTWWSWGELQTISQAVEKALTDSGLAELGEVGVLVRNRPGVIGSILGLLANRRGVVIFNSHLPAAGVAKDVEKLRPAALIVDEADREDEQLLAAVRNTGTLLIGSDGQVLRPRDPAAADREPARQRGTVAFLMLTSGTTGPPKRVPISFDDLDHTLLAHSRIGIALTEEPRFSKAVDILAIPPVNVTGMWQMLTSLSRGRRLVLMDRFVVDQWAALVKEHQVRNGRIPPAAVKMVLDSDVDPADLSTLSAIWAGGAPMDVAVGERFEEVFGVPVLTTYGATEFTGGIAVWSLSDWKEFGPLKRGSVGRPNDGVEIRTVDAETGEPLGPHESGMLLVRTAQRAEAGESTWVRTNDIGRLDEDGFLWVEGRADGVINRGGFKVSPHDVEAALRKHPAVRDVAVVGLPDERLGSVPGALVVAGAAPPEVAELKDLVRASLAPYCVPTVIRFTDEIPRNAGLKVDLAATKQALTAP